MIAQILRRSKIKAGFSFPAATKSLIAIGALITGLQSADAQSVQSPKGAEVFSNSQSAMPVPFRKAVRIGWSYPVNFQTPDMVFKVYHTTNLNLDIRQWALLTNVPGSSRSVTFPADQPQEFFAVTVSNFLGESDFGTR